MVFFFFLLLAMLQADDEDEIMEQQMKSPFGSSFRTFDATDYKPIGTVFSSHWINTWQSLPQQQPIFLVTIISVISYEEPNLRFSKTIFFVNILSL